MEPTPPTNNLATELLEVARLVLLQDEDPRMIERLFRRIMSTAGAHRGYVVVREGDGFIEKFELNFSRAGVSPQERRFSRTLVRTAMQEKDIKHTANVHQDQGAASQGSVMGLAPASVVVIPLTAAEEAYGAIYLERPVHLKLTDEVKDFLQQAAEMAAQSIRRQLTNQALRQRNAALERDLFARNNFEGIITRDRAMLSMLETVAQVADAAAPVLVRGETGTGKELIARALHVNSGRRERPFVALHCGALSPTVLESELFGHMKGAFTGADRERPGRIASAHRSTLFLDEIAEIPIDIQAKLLRFLQFGELQRVGSDKTEKVDVRVVAATNQDVGDMIRAGKFRQDLYFRLNVIELVLPPLRERRGDLPLLVTYFLRHHWQRKGEQPHLPPAVEQALASYEFPGNIRELDHLIERACLLATGPELGMNLFPALAKVVPGVTGAGAGPMNEFKEYTNTELSRLRDEVVADLERRFVNELMRRNEGNVSKAARAADMQRSYLQKLLARHRGE